MRLTIFLSVSVLLTMFLFISQLGIDQAGLEEGIDAPNYFNYDGSHIAEFNNGDTNTYELNANYTDTLPGGSGEVTEASGNVFTDTFKAIRNWLLSVTGLKYVLGVLNAIPNFLSLFLPNQIAFALGYMWHALTLFSLIFWIKGGSQ
jgi:hypothetical protein